MSHFKRLATPQSLPSAQLVLRSHSKLTSRAPKAARSSIVKTCLTRDGGPDIREIETRFLSLLVEASTTRTHDHSLHRRPQTRAHVIRTHTSIGDVHHQARRELTTSSAQHSLAQATAVADPPAPQEYSHWSTANKIPRTEFYALFGKRRRTLTRKEELTREVKDDGIEETRDWRSPEEYAAATWYLPGGNVMPVAWNPVAKSRHAVNDKADKLGEALSAAGKQATVRTDEGATGPYGLKITPPAHFLAIADSADQHQWILDSDLQTPEDFAHAERVQRFPLARRLSPLKDEPVDNLQEHAVSPVQSEGTLEALREFKFLTQAYPGLGSKAKMWEAFESLDKPQVRYVSARRIRRFFTHLALAEHHAETGTREKVLSLYQQCLDENVWLDRASFTTIMTYAGRGDRQPTRENVKEAIQVWAEMEERGIMADDAVFNTLYHIAVKARRFSLARVLLDEVKARKLAINRYMRCSMIAFAGRCGDDHEVRAAFSDLVNAGEIVDTAVMNCVLSALVEADDGEGAESTFDNMKSLYDEQFPTHPIAAWQDRRRLARRANKAKRRIQNQQRRHRKSFFSSSYAGKDRLQELQLLSPVAPDAATYRIMVGYHALRSGDFDRARALMEEMKALSFHIHGSVYNKLFRGFALHRDQASRRSWSQFALDALFKEFVKAAQSSRASDESTEEQPLIDQRASDFMKATQHSKQQHFDARPDGMQPFQCEDELFREAYFSLALAKTILTAFRSCTGVVRMKQAAKTIRIVWTDMTLAEADELDSHEQACVETRRHLRVYQPHYAPDRSSPSNL